MSLYLCFSIASADKVSHEVLVFAIELWLAYLQPWKCEGLNSSYSAKWKSYVIANFHFYSTLFCILIQSLCDKMATSYSIQDGNSLRLVNYLDVILNQLYGGKGSESGAPCALKILIDQCGSALKNVLKCSLTAGSGRMGGSPTRGSRGSFIGSPTPNSYSNGRNTAESVYTLSRSDIFVLACQHRLLYPDPSVLSDLEDCGIIPCIVTCCQPFITKFYEVLATLQCGYESNAASTSDDSRVNAEKQQGGAAKEAFKGRDGILGHVEWAENCLRTFLGFHSLTPSKLSATAIPSNKNTQRIEAIAKHIAAVFPTNPLTDFVALCDTMRITSASSRLHSIAGDGTLDTLQKEFSRRKRILDMHLPCTYFNDLDRDRVGKVTEVSEEFILYAFLCSAN